MGKRNLEEFKIAAADTNKRGIVVVFRLVFLRLGSRNGNNEKIEIFELFSGRGNLGTGFGVEF